MVGIVDPAVMAKLLTLATAPAPVPTEIKLLEPVNSSTGARAGPNCFSADLPSL